MHDFFRCLHYFSSSAKLEIHSKDYGKLNLREISEQGRQMIEFQ